MDNALMFYREVAPSENFKHLVLSFWEFSMRGKNPAPIQHEIFPDGCVSLFYHCNEKFNIRRLFFSGLNLETIIAPVFVGDIYWGMRISPAACTNILRTKLANFLQYRGFEAGEFPHLTRKLLESFDSCKTLADAVTIYENRLTELDFGQNSFDRKIAQAVEIIEQTGGEIKIVELAQNLNLGIRQLERRFKQSSGLTPKQFARTRRFRATVVDLVENENVNWANRAAEMGFADQAHLNREFVSVTKRSPSSFAEKVKQIEHGNLIK